MGAARNRGTKEERIAQACARAKAEALIARIESERVAAERQARLAALPEDQQMMRITRGASKSRSRAAMQGIIATALGLMVAATTGR